jgi:hypothetical protein
VQLSLSLAAEEDNKTSPEKGGKAIDEKDRREAHQERKGNMLDDDI